MRETGQYQSERRKISEMMKSRNKNRILLDRGKMKITVGVNKSLRGPEERVGQQGKGWQVHCMYMYM